MNTYKRHRFSPDVISYAVWLYYRFNLSHRRCGGPFIEDLLAEKGITVSYESIRLCCIKFGASGYIGSNLVPFLTKRGKRVRAVSRNPAVLEGREWPRVRCF